MQGLIFLPNPPIRKSLPFAERGVSEGKEKSGCYLSGGPSIMREKWERRVSPLKLGKIGRMKLYNSIGQY